jgi:hypothetical protein
MPKESTWYLIGEDGERHRLGVALVEVGNSAEECAEAMSWLALAGVEGYTLSCKLLITNNSRRWAGLPLRRGKLNRRNYGQEFIKKASGEQEE